LKQVPLAQQKLESSQARASLAQQKSLLGSPSVSLKQDPVPQQVAESAHQDSASQQVVSPKQVSPAPQQTPVAVQKRASVQHTSPGKQLSLAGQQSPPQSMVVHSHIVPVQTSSGSGQLPSSHTPPQPSASPHALPSQSGTHTHTPPTQIWLGSAQGPSHRPSQPSTSPHMAPAQSDSQATHSLKTQIAGGSHSHSQVVWHAPLTQIEPASQTTP
jgi:hypothetical protein